MMMMTIDNCLRPESGRPDGRKDVAPVKDKDKEKDKDKGKGKDKDKDRAEAGRPDGRKDSGAGQLLRDSAAAATLCLTTSRDQQVCSRTHSALSTRTNKHSAPVCVFTVLSQPGAVRACS